MSPLSPAAGLAGANMISRSIVLRTKSSVQVKVHAVQQSVHGQAQSVAANSTATTATTTTTTTTVTNTATNPIAAKANAFPSSAGPRMNMNMNMNMNISSCQIASPSAGPKLGPGSINSSSNINLTIVRSFTSMKRDKYGRLLQRRIVVRGSNGNNNRVKKKKNGSKNKQKDSQSSFWPKLPKIITPTNVIPQPIQPIPVGGGGSSSSSSASTTALSLSSSSASSSSASTSASASVSSALRSSSNATPCIITESAAIQPPSISTPLPSTSASTGLSSTAGADAGSGTSTLSSTSSSSAASSTLSTTSTSTNTATALAATTSKNKNNNNNNNKTRKKFLQWLKQNAGTIVLNIGSIATLTGFTRTDMLELRFLSMAGSSSTIIYFLSRTPDLVYGPIIWSSIFLFTNSYMAYGILEERKGKTRQFTIQEEDLYEEHFLPYGVTPRMYEKLLSCCTQIQLKRGEVLIEKGQKFDAVYLVTSGSTSGMTNLHRRVTAASSKKGNREKLSGGDAGAWIGELAFLELLGEESSPTTSTLTVSVDAHAHADPRKLKRKVERSNAATDDKKNNGVSIPTGGGGGVASAALVRNQLTKMAHKMTGDNNRDSNTSLKESHDSNTGGEGVVKTLATAAVNSTGTKTIQMNENNSGNHDDSSKKRKSINRALLTYIASQDTTLIKWDFQELANLLSTSTELRLAVTRAMTAAVVNKVVNLYVSKQKGDHDHKDILLEKSRIKDATVVAQGDEDEEVEAHDDEPDVSMWKQWMVNASSKTAKKIQKEEEEEEKKMRNVPGAHRQSSLKPGAVRLNVVKEHRK